MTNKTGDFTSARNPLGERDESVSEYKCPCCGSTSIEHVDNDYSPDMVYLHYRCKACDSEFEHQYEFTGVYVINDNR